MRVYGEQLNSVQTYVLSGQSAFEGQGIVNGRFICIATAWCFGKKRKKKHATDCTNLSVSFFYRHKWHQSI